MKNACVATVQNAEVRQAVHEAIELIGGLEKLISKSLEKKPRFLIKPNACMPANYDSGVVTNFNVIEAIVDEVKAIDGVPIIGESCINSSPEKTHMALKASGIWSAAERQGVKIVNFDLDEEVEVDIPKGIVLKKIGVAKTVLECDLRISVPVLKYHPYTKVTLSLKNMKGCLPGKNKQETHSRGLHQAIADYNTVLKPHLSIIDGTTAGVWRGLKSPVKLNAIIAGFDPVATDTIGSLILSVDPATVEHLECCARHDLGVSNVNEIKLKGIPFQQIAIQ